MSPEKGHLFSPAENMPLHNQRGPEDIKQQLAEQMEKDGNEAREMNRKLAESLERKRQLEQEKANQEAIEL